MNVISRLVWLPSTVGGCAGVLTGSKRSNSGRSDCGCKQSRRSMCKVCEMYKDAGSIPAVSTIFFLELGAGQIEHRFPSPVPLRITLDGLYAGSIFSVLSGDVVMRV